MINFFFIARKSLQLLMSPLDYIECLPIRLWVRNPKNGRNNPEIVIDTFEKNKTKSALKRIFLHSNQEPQYTSN